MVLSIPLYKLRVLVSFDQNFASFLLEELNAKVRLSDVSAERCSRAIVNFLYDPTVVFNSVD